MTLLFLSKRQERKALRLQKIIRKMADLEANQSYCSSARKSILFSSLVATLNVASVTAAVISWVYKPFSNAQPNPVTLGIVCTPFRFAEFLFVTLGLWFTLTRATHSSSVCYFITLVLCTIGLFVFVPYFLCYVVLQCSDNRYKCNLGNFEFGVDRFYSMMGSAFLYHLLSWLNVTICYTYHKVVGDIKPTKFCFCFITVTSTKHLFYLILVLKMSLLSFFVAFVIWFMMNGFEPSPYLILRHLVVLVNLKLLIFLIYGFAHSKPSALTLSMILCCGSFWIGLVFFATHVARFYASAWQPFYDVPKNSAPSLGEQNRDRPADDMCIALSFFLSFFCQEILTFKAIRLIRNKLMEIAPVSDSTPDADNTSMLPRISFSDLLLLEIVGIGNFAEVWKTLLTQRNGEHLVVGAKKLKPGSTDSSKLQLIQEAYILSQLNHENIVRPISLCLDHQPSMILCIEYMNSGSLQKHLRSRRARDLLCQLDLVKIAISVAKACNYLEENHLIHRDISAKNCLVACEEGHVQPSAIKLADFGLAKDIRDSSYSNPNAMKPWLYTAPEGFKGDFGLGFDQWSFGILLWEIFSWCATPYGKCHWEHHSCQMQALNPVEIEPMVCERREHLLSLPDPCTSCFTESLKTVMAACFHYNPINRPKFSRVLLQLEALQTEFENEPNGTLPCFPWRTGQPENSQRVPECFHLDVAYLGNSNRVKSSGTKITPV